MHTEHFFTRMYQAHFEYVRRMLVKYGVPWRDSEDTAHDVFIAVWEALWRYDPKRPFKHWLFFFIKHVAADYRHRLRYDCEELHGHPGPIPDEAPSAEEALGAHAERLIAARAVQRLPPDCQAVLMMHVDGWTMPEIVAKLGIPLDTGYTRLRRARAQAYRYARAAERPSKIANLPGCRSHFSRNRASAVGAVLGPLVPRP